MKVSQYRLLMFWVLLTYTKVSILSSDGTLVARILIALGFTLSAGFMVGALIAHWKEPSTKKAIEQPEVHP